MKDKQRQEEIFNEVFEERKKQDVKWGEQNHHPGVWQNILMEEVGEVSKEVNENKFNAKEFSDYRKEMIQVAAVAIAAIESLDRNLEE